MHDTAQRPPFDDMIQYTGQEAELTVNDEKRIT
jgi:hypothetical protein